MGCDIHGYLEVKNNNNEWICANFYQINRFFEDEGGIEFSIVNLLPSRNYTRFTQLCGVRDYTGSCIPISQPKGLPSDVCKEIKKESDYWGSYGHSHSYVTLKEVMDYRKNLPPIKYTGLLSQKQIEELDRGIKPSYWCQGTSAVGYQRREWEEEFDALEELEQEMVKQAKKASWWFFNEEKPENVRFVFWFDN